MKGFSEKRQNVLNKNNIVSLFLLFLVICFAVRPVFAQEKNYFELRGILINKQYKIKNGFIKVFEKATIVDSVRTSAEGKFRIYLDFNKEFTIKFMKPGFLEKEVVFSTKIPKGTEKNKWETFIPVSLFPDEQASDTQNAVAHYEYNEDANGFFDSKLDYTKKSESLLQKAKREQLKLARKRKRIQNEIDNLSSETRESLGIAISNRKKESANFDKIVSEKLKNARNESARILKEARIMAENIINSATPSVAVSTRTNSPSDKLSVSSLTESEIKNLLGDYEQFQKREDIKELQRQRKELNLLKEKTKHDSVLLLESNVVFQEELLKSAKFQLKIDRLNAKTSEDSLLIAKREQFIRQTEEQLNVAKNQIEIAATQIKLQELEIRNKTLFLTSSLIGLGFLFLVAFFIYKSYRDKKKMADILAKTNQELEKLSIVASETDNAVRIMNAKGDYEWANEGFSRMYGIDFQSFKSETPNILNSEKESSIKEAINTCISKKQSVLYESKTQTDAQHEIWMQTTLTPILNSEKEITKIVAIDSDISKQKKAEEQILHQKNVLELQNENIKGSIRYAKTIQQAILPIKAEMDRVFNSFLIYRPKDIVSGDFIWFARISEKQTIVAVVDCTGHGVPGAFMSMIGNTLLNEIVNVRQIHEPRLILDTLHAEVKKSLKQEQSDNNDGMDVCLCKIERSDSEQVHITFSGAKRPLFYYDANDAEIKTIKGDVKSIGGRRHRPQKEKQFTNKNITLSSKSTIYLSSDGMIDQGGLKPKKFGVKRFISVAYESSQLPIEEQKTYFESALDAYQQTAEQRDDITVLGISFDKN